MKKMLFLFFMFSVITSSCSREEKYKSLVKDYLSRNIDDFDSYEPVEFTALIPDSTFYLDDNKYKDIEKIIDIYKQRCGFDTESTVIDTVDLPQNYYQDAIDSILKYNNIQSDFAKNYKSVQKGWCVGHSFRAINNGSKKLFRCVFYFNMNCDTITNVRFNDEVE